MITQSRAISHFSETVTAWNRSSMQLVSSAALCFIAGAYATDEKDRSDYTKTMATLKDLVTEKGLKTAQAYKYIGLARQLVIRLVKEHPLLDGVIHDVLDARAANSATTVLLTYLDKNKVTSLDTLGVFLGGAYQRTATNTPAGTNAGNGRGGNNRVPGQVPATATSEQIVEAIVGRDDPLEIFRNLVDEIDDVEVIKTMQSILDDRLDELNDKKPKAKRGRPAGKRQILTVNG